MSIMAIFSCLFRLSCVVLSCSAIIWNIYQFNLDKDSVEIEVHEMNSAKYEFLPSLTFCFHYKQIHQTNKTSDYSFNTDDHLQDGYENQIAQIDDYIGDILVKRKNKEKRAVFTKTGIKSTYYDETKYTGPSRQIVLRREPWKVCLDISIPLKKIAVHSIEVAVQKDVFYTKRASEINTNKIRFTDLEMGLTFHGQTFLFPNRKLIGAELYNNMNANCMKIIFYVTKIEIYRRRNKPNSPCMENYKNDAYRILKYAARRLGCTPNGWKINSSIPDCQVEMLNETDSKSFNLITAGLHYFQYTQISKSCESVRDVQTQYDSDSSIRSCTDDEGVIRVTLIYDNFPLTETRLVRSYTALNLFYNIGYIFGLFLGVSIIQIPDMFAKLYRAMCRKIDVVTNHIHLTMYKTQFIPH